MKVCYFYTWFLGLAFLHHQQPALLPENENNDPNTIRTFMKQQSINYFSPLLSPHAELCFAVTDAKSCHCLKNHNYDDDDEDEEDDDDDDDEGR